MTACWNHQPVFGDLQYCIFVYWETDRTQLLQGIHRHQTPLRYRNAAGGSRL